MVGRTGEQLQRPQRFLFLVPDPRIQQADPIEERRVHRQKLALSFNSLDDPVLVFGVDIEIVGAVTVVTSSETFVLCHVRAA